MSSFVINLLSAKESCPTLFESSKRSRNIVKSFVQPEGEVGYGLLPTKKGDDAMAVEEVDADETQSAKDRKAEQTLFYRQQVVDRGVIERSRRQRNVEQNREGRERTQETEGLGGTREFERLFEHHVQSSSSSSSSSLFTPPPSSQSSLNCPPLPSSSSS
ncbi:hypothetical protein JCM5350_002394 [Sporobolomyces pararoseus]